MQKRPSHPRAAPRKPVGVVTRGKTAANRLRRVDLFFMRYDPGLFTRADGAFANALFVDLGYGAEATTTLESAARLRALNPALPVLGIEIDPARVAAATPFVDARTHFRLGGFNMPLQAGETVRAVRMFNVLRQYEEHEVQPALDRVASYVLPGGLIVEGTSNPFGSIWVSNVIRKREQGEGWRAEALAFSTNFRNGFDITALQTVLPKNYIHRMTPGESIYEFMEAWKRAAAERVAAKAWGARAWFVAAGERLREMGWPVRAQRKWLDKGFLIWDLTP